MEFNTIDIIGYVATALIAISSLPQVIKTITTKNTKGISLLMFLLLFVGNSMWFAYGIALKNLPMIIGNSISILLYAIMITFKIVNIARGKDTLLKKEED